ncbi:MAG: hypothetical protein EBX52_13505 [Proteobacteria bacterium]|nr:hypothetical protein [Pseudomonadota bacterium]
MKNLVPGLKRIFSAAFLFVFLAPVYTVSSAIAAPPCLDANGSEVRAGNQQVLQWKTSTPNQFLSRAHVAGVIENIYPVRNGHYHFQIKIGPGLQDTIELIYNISFGTIPRLVPGSRAEACGDYITSIAPTQNYEPSPDGAIVHWIHRSPNPARHASGYLEIDGTLYGNN